MKINICLFINENTTPKIESALNNGGVPCISITASTFTEAQKLMQNAEHIARDLIKKHPTQAQQNAPAQNANETFARFPISIENAKYEINAIASNAPGYKSGAHAYKMVKQGELLSRKYKNVTAPEIRALSLRACAGDLYGTIVDAYFCGFYKGYNAHIADIKRGDKKQ